MMFSETPVRDSGRKVATTEAGIESAMMTVEGTSRRKKNSTSTASRPPMSAADQTWLTAAEM